MSGNILYCGDTDLHGAASYLAGMLTRWGWEFDYVPSHIRLSADQLKTPRSLLILSDYPATQFSEACQTLALQQIEAGCGLLMIGGWESFHGLGGDWDKSILSKALPVEIQSVDDRLNFDQSAWLLPTVEDHPILKGLPWFARPPAIGGMNRVTTKPDAVTLLEACSFTVSGPALSRSKPGEHPRWDFAPAERLPALTVGAYGQGRTAAFMSDVAPHWVGGFVDWGQQRVTGQAANAGAIEVGGLYAQFWQQLIEWTRGRG